MKTIYYTDPLHDDFANNGIQSRPLPEDYTYISSDPLRRSVDFLFYHCVAIPLVYVYQKVRFREKIVNRRALFPYLLSGFYLYGNHTRAAGDAFTPNMISFPRKAYIVTSSDAVAIPGVRQLVASLGGLPLPDTLAGMRKFRDALAKRSRHGCICIYPEAHIWPYYTGIRPFPATAFRYPVEYNKPVFAFTVTYQKRKHQFFPKTVVYIDGPFFPDPALTTRENSAMLREKIYTTMLKRSERSNYERYHYVQRHKETETDSTVNEDVLRK